MEDMTRNVIEGKKKNRKRKFEELSVKKPKLCLKPIKSQSDVALSIAQRLFLNDKNVVFSPLSLHALLGIVAAGSDGSTLRELLSFLGYNSIDHLNSATSQLISVARSDASSAGGPRLSFANGVWGDQSLSLQHSFKQLVANDYKASLTSVNFRKKAGEVANEVNLWVKKETNSLIKDLLTPGSVDHSTRLILVNALYFKGKWLEKFNASMTKSYNFHLLNGSSVKVPFMTSKKKQFISAFKGFKVLCLPYKEGPHKQGEDKRRFSMYIFLPNAKKGLSALVEQLTSKDGFLESKLPRQKVDVGDFRIPRFKISFGFEASNVLKELGVVSPFSKASANFTKMVESVGEDLYVSKIFHKSFIEVNEEGTVAAAASALLSNVKCRQQRSTPVDFIADHPFLFVIREEVSGTILFTRQVLNPLAR